MKLKNHPPAKGINQIDRHGTGNSKTTATKKELIRLNNIPITQSDFEEILDKMPEEYRIVLQGTEIYYSGNLDAKRWGSAKANNGTCKMNHVRINRHSILVVLHEIAHIITHNKAWEDGKVTPPQPHGRTFGATLDALIKTWQNIETKAEMDQILAEAATKNESTPMQIAKGMIEAAIYTKKQIKTEMMNYGAKKSYANTFMYRVLKEGDKNFFKQEVIETENGIIMFF